MDIQERYRRWIRASHGTAVIDPFFVPTIQGLGRLDCEILAGDQRYGALDPKARESVSESDSLTQRFVLSYLWAIGSFENFTYSSFPDEKTLRTSID
jgi:hypothetical protein